MASDSVMDERTLREICLTGFEIAVKEGKAKSIMSSYNRVNGTYANENRHLLQEILRDQWGFEGFVVSDWDGSNNHVEGVRAGSNLEMPTTGGDSDLELVEEVKSGKLSEELLDQRIGELLGVVLSTRTPPSSTAICPSPIRKRPSPSRTPAAWTGLRWPSCTRPSRTATCFVRPRS